MSKGTDRHRDDPEAPWNRQQLARATRKDTKQFCKGNPKHPHVPVVTGPSYAADWLRCKAVEDGSWWELKRGPWMCVHRSVCQRCGKVLRPYLAWQECPDLPAELRSA